MKENVYDKESFFEKYGEMLRSKEGLKGAGEWPTLEKILPDFEGKRTLDLGCGYGWHCMYAVSKGANHVVGIDLSEKMLQEAEKKKESDRIEYHRIGIEDYDYPSNRFDVVISSLALHYIENLEEIFRKVYRTLAQGGTFVFTMEHPIFTAHGNEDWFYNTAGTAQHWPVDHYFTEGYRETSFLGETVVKFHHTLTSILQGLLQAGFTITNVIEPQPTKEMLQKIKDMEEELRRPMMLAVSAVKI